MTEQILVPPLTSQIYSSPVKLKTQNLAQLK